MKMVKIKVADAPLKALDWLVAQTEGQEYSPTTTYNAVGMEFPATDYSTNWSLGGPIIERERIDLQAKINAGSDYDEWLATKGVGSKQRRRYGPTPLIAAMRCLVASKLGPEVEVPEELSK